MTVACFPSIDSTFPTDVKPLIRTLSPVMITPPLCCFRTAFFRASAAACCFSAFVLRCCSCFSLRFLILPTFFWKSSSESKPPFSSLFLFDLSDGFNLSSSIKPASYWASSCRILFVSSFSACFSLISLMAFSIRLLLSLISSSACRFARLRISFLLCSKASISRSYRAILFDSSFS